MHKIRFAQDLALYNLTLTEEIEGFDGTAHLDAWNNDAEWQGVRKVTEALTAIDDDWGESIFATNVVFEPLLGELFRSNLVMQAAAANGDFVTPDHHRRRRVRLLTARPALDPGVLRPARGRQGVRRPQQAADAGVAVEVGAAVSGGGAASCSRMWSQPDAKPPRFEDSLDRAKSRFAGIVSDLGLKTPEELTK